MIRLTCTQCKTELTIDDAFAGGACRCQHCGAIQTVPKRFKGNADTGLGMLAAAAEPKQPPVAKAGEQKAIYQRGPRSDGNVSSGMARLASPKVHGSNPPAPSTDKPVTKEPPPAARNKSGVVELSMPLLIGGAIVLLMAGVLIGMLLKK